MKEPTEFEYFKGWLLFFIVATIGGGILGLVVDAFVSAFLGAGGMPLARIPSILRIVGDIVVIPVSYVTFRAVVGKYLFPKLEDDEPPKT